MSKNYLKILQTRNVFTVAFEYKVLVELSGAAANMHRRFAQSVVSAGFVFVEVLLVQALCIVTAVAFGGESVRGDYKIWGRAV